MSLMFQRLARNYMKNGYYPTDTETTRRILNALGPTTTDVMRICDPCCGEGVALAEVHHHLGQNAVESYGIEFDEERAYQAKQLLTTCIHGDIQNCVVSLRQFGLLWLNPPYGDLVTDTIAASNLKWKGRKRLEKLFYYRTNSYLVLGGVLVLIIPQYSLDRELSTWIARHFDRVQVFKAPEQQFKQIVVFGIRRRSSGVSSVVSIQEELTQIGVGDVTPSELPWCWTQELYTVPSATQSLGKFKSIRPDAKQIQEVISSQPCLWERFELIFSAGSKTQRRPLRELSEWHLALALAAGEVSGVVRSQDGRTYLIKGDTYKEKQRSHRIEREDDGTVIETTVLTDKFFPTIRAVDFTEGSSSYGDVLTIR